MGLNEQLTNLKLIVKKDRRIWAIGAFILVVLVLWRSSDNPRRVAPVQSSGTAQQGASANQTLGGEAAFRDLVSSIGRDVDKISKTSDEQRKVLDRTIRDYQNDRKQYQGIFDSVADRIDNVDKTIQNLENKLQDMNTQGVPAVAANQQVDVNISGPEAFGFQEASIPKPVAPAQPLKMTFISPGDTVPVTLLTGVNAPVDGTPYPVLFKIKGPITGPDGASLDIGEARLIAAATGSETDSRALFRLSDLAIRHRDGRRSVVKVDGWVVGEDGIRGMSGRLVDKLGRLIMATFGVSYTAALGDRLTDKASNLNVENSEAVTINADDMDFASVSAFSDASNRLGKILIDRYEKLVPVVEVLSGRDVAAVFSAPAEVEMMEDNSEDIYNPSVD